MTWQSESAAALTRGAGPGESRMVGLCAVCHSPVRWTDEPLPIYRQPFNPYPSGVIHGAFDCMDADRCEIVISATTSSGEYSAQCVLPADHPEPCLPGEA